MTAPLKQTTWQQLQSLANSMKNRHLLELFEQDSNRFDKYSIQIPGVLFDFSKNLIDDSVFDLLETLAEERGLRSRQQDLFSGKKINVTEGRAVLHTALRADKSEVVEVDGVNQVPLVHCQLNRMCEFTEKVRAGLWLGQGGNAITDVVNVGIGGSNLGPAMVCEALSYEGNQPLNLHFVSTVDGHQISKILRPLDPQTTLFIISSKTFTTSETLTNADTARQWLLQGGVADPNSHLVAVTANKENAQKFGVENDQIFEFWDWVGGRFSLWSAIGLPIALKYGFDIFQELLKGAKAMDEHFLCAPWSQNIPVVMAMMSLWNTTFMGRHSHVILPYEQSLKLLPSYLQQAEMESNGKSVSTKGTELNYATSPAIWGDSGIDGQHAFYQFLHQSHSTFSADFIGVVTPKHELKHHHKLLMANMFAQSKALMSGVSLSQVKQDLQSKGIHPKEINLLAQHKVHPGNKPSNTLIFDELSPYSLGQLVCAYEHKIFTHGVLLDICSFDQWGVELGKVLAKDIHREFEDGSTNQNHDSSTSSQIDYILKKWQMEADHVV